MLRCRKLLLNSPYIVCFTADVILFHSIVAFISFSSSYLQFVIIFTSICFGLLLVHLYTFARFCSYIQQVASDSTKLATCFSQHVHFHRKRKLHFVVKHGVHYNSSPCPASAVVHKLTENMAVGIRCADRATPSIRKSWHQLRRNAAAAWSV
jgi:uncharacterized membrane protein YedE/YeeE